MSNLLDDIRSTRTEAMAQLMEAETINELEELKVKFLGRKGRINKFVKNLKNLEPEERKRAGQMLNETKQAIDSSIEEQKKLIATKHNEAKEWFDPSFPGIKYKTGQTHPTTIVINEMFDIFRHLGFSILEGPEIETDEYNYGKLNLPKDHPARSLQDALYVKEPEILLRAHTSTVEARALSVLKPPYRIVVAGKCYRFENVNASNNAMFYQFQGFSLQRGLSMADLKGTLYYFVEKFFGKHREIRYRCKYYPEVEPGVGLDLDCPFCNKKGCPVCKGRGWLEMLGAGMIHPNMLKENGYDPKDISGFAFGMGLDRIVMDRFKINDIRSLYNGDIKY
jgi:phenylalanyl-tRNA synthetase alpha chain